MGIPLYYHSINISHYNLTFIAQVKYKCDSIEHREYLFFTLHVILCGVVWRLNLGKVENELLTEEALGESSLNCKKKY